jgi:hypothetical protein
MLDLLFDLLIPQSKLGLALWGVALFVLLLVAAAILLGWAVLT